MKFEFFTIKEDDIILSEIKENSLFYIGNSGGWLCLLELQKLKEINVPISKRKIKNLEKKNVAGVILLII